VNAENKNAKTADEMNKFFRTDPPQSRKRVEADASYQAAQRANNVTLMQAIAAEILYGSGNTKSEARESAMKKRAEKLGDRYLTDD
jgi:hypothetical protein